MAAYRFPLYGGLWCLGQAAISALFHWGYAVHELSMGLGALIAAGLVAAGVALWRFVHPVAT